MESPRQKFWLWAADGEIDLGDEELDNRPAEEIWRSPKSRDPDLGKRTRYQLFVGNEQIHWTVLPRDHAIFVPRDIPVVTREAACYFKDLNASPKPRAVGPLVRVKWQLFTNDKEEAGPLVDALIPNEITLTQFVAGFIVPEFEGRFDFGNMFTWNLEERQVQPKKGEKLDKTQRIVIPIPELYSFASAEVFSSPSKVVRQRLPRHHRMQGVKTCEVLVSKGRCPAAHPRGYPVKPRPHRGPTK
jgi:hypothetical protein